MSMLEQAFLVMAVSNLTVGIYIWTQRKDCIGKTFLAFTLILSGWSYALSQFVSVAETSYAHRLATLRLSQLIAIFIPYTWMCSIHALLNIHDKSRRIQSGVLAATLMLASISFSPHFVKGVAPRFNYPYYLEPGPLYILFFVLLFVVIVRGMMQMIYALRRSGKNAERKEQWAYVLGSNIILFACGGSTFAPVYHIPAPPWLLALMLAYPFLLGYAALHHGVLHPESFVATAYRRKLTQLGMFTAMLNHQIKNPIYLARNTLENMTDSNQTFDREETAAFIKKQRDQLTRATEAIDHLSHFLKPDVNTAFKKKKYASLPTAVQKVINLFKSAPSGKQVTFLNDVPHDAPHVRCNDGHLEEVLFNLIDNACRAVEDGSVIHLFTTRQNGSVTLHLKDSGCGIPGDRMDTLFEPFIAGEKHDDSWGIGLYIARQLMEKNGGSIEAESRIGEGTTFRLKFKAAK